MRFFISNLPVINFRLAGDWHPWLALSKTARRRQV